MTNPSVADLVGTIRCAVCGQDRRPALAARAICRPCLRAERAERAPCASCGKVRVVAHKAARLCNRCLADRRAARTLRPYVAGFASPYPYNTALFARLAATLDWATVTAAVKRRFRLFGRFLQTRPLPEPLTWEAIEAALPALGPTNRHRPKQIRACLRDLGHLLAARGELESREAYVLRRRALAPLTRAPAHIRPLLGRFTAWLWARRTVPSTVRTHLTHLATFWSWCDARGIRSPAEVQRTTVTAYLLALRWQWRCVACGEAIAYDPDDRVAPAACGRCHALHTLEQIRRYAPATVAAQRAKLLVFFDWARLNRLVVANPVHHPAPAVQHRLRHYPPEVVTRLCAYAAAPDAEPIEALALYLILFHALSAWELCHAQIPTLRALRDDVPVPPLAEAYYLLIPRRPPSLGDRSPGRPEVRLDFPVKAAGWLRPLLARFEQRRRAVLADHASPLLFVTPGSVRHDTPVSDAFIQRTVQRASRRVLGAACTAGMLRKTAGILFADRAGAGVLRWLGWDERQAFAYTWADREVVWPRAEDGPV